MSHHTYNGQPLNKSGDPRGEVVINADPLVLKENAALRAALVDAVAIIDRLLATKDGGWTAEDVKKLEAVRAMAVL